MRKKLILAGTMVFFLFLLSACSHKISQKTVDSRKADYEQYLKNTYPGETFDVKVWVEYAEITGGAGLPDYKGEILRTVITDAKGNRFKIFDDGSGHYFDDYQKVLDGTKHYNEKGQEVIYKEDGTVWFVND